MNRPPAFLERVVGLLIPPACREHVLGDLHERYTSLSQYVREAIGTLPLVISSQARRNFRIELCLSEACVLYLTFAGVVLAGRASFNVEGGLLPLIVSLLPLRLCLTIADAYIDPQDASPRRQRLELGVALTLGLLMHSVLRLFYPEWTLSASVVLTGTVVSVPMLIMLRDFFRPIRRDVATSAGAMSVDEIRRQAREQYRKAWSLNSLWLICALVLILTTPKPDVLRQAVWWKLTSAVFLVAVIGLTFWRSMKGFIGAESEQRSLSIKADPYRSRLAGKREGLLFWAGGGLFGLLPGAGAALLIYLVAVPLVTFFLRWMAGAPATSDITASRVWIAFVAFLVLCVAWVFVRAVNLRAAEAMRRELETLDSSDDDR